MMALLPLVFSFAGIAWLINFPFLPGPLLLLLAALAWHNYT